MTCCVLVFWIEWSTAKLPYHGKRTSLYCYGSWGVRLHSSWCSYLDISITKISHLLHLTAAMSYTGIYSWIMVYGCTVLYHPGKNNVIVNTFSQHLHCDVIPIKVGKNDPLVFFNFTSKHLNNGNDPDLLECFLNLPIPDIKENNPVDSSGYRHNRT